MISCKCPTASQVLLGVLNDNINLHRLLYTRLIEKIPTLLGTSPPVPSANGESDGNQLATSSALQIVPPGVLVLGLGMKLPVPKDRLDCPDVKFWNSDEWLKSEKPKAGKKGRHSDKINKAQRFIERADGTPIPGGDASSIRAMTHMLLMSLARNGQLAETVNNLTFEAQAYLHTHLSDQWPELLFCEGGIWKINTLLGQVYPGFKKNWKKRVAAMKEPRFSVPGVKIEDIMMKMEANDGSESESDDTDDGSDSSDSEPEPSGGTKRGRGSSSSEDQRPKKKAKSVTQLLPPIPLPPQSNPSVSTSPPFTSTTVASPVSVSPSCDDMPSSPTVPLPVPLLPLEPLLSQAHPSNTVQPPGPPGISIIPSTPAETRISQPHPSEDRLRPCISSPALLGPDLQSQASFASSSPQNTATNAFAQPASSIDSADSHTASFSSISSTDPILANVLGLSSANSHAVNQVLTSLPLLPS
jgi:hypothetical protein